MSTYRPTDLRIAAALLVVLLGVLLVGYVLMRMGSRRYGPKLGWVALVLGVVGIERFCASEPAGFRMLALITFALLTLKLLAVVSERANGMPPLSLAAWLGFATAWLGMQPRLFVSYGSPPLDGAGVLLRRGAVNAAAGVALVVLARATWLRTESRLAATLPLLVGLSLCLHFGIGSLLAGAWRLRGVAAAAPFRAPLRSTSLAEFWSRRWNLGFSEMTATLLYRPLSERLGKSPALADGIHRFRALARDGDQRARARRLRPSHALLRAARRPRMGRAGSRRGQGVRFPAGSGARGVFSGSWHHCRCSFTDLSLRALSGR